MSNQLSEEQIYKKAKKRVEAKNAFRTHLTVYICVNILLILIWVFSADEGFPWFIFPLGGWGIGLFFHYMGTFGSIRKTDRVAIDKEVEKIRRAQTTGC